jgi:hypothetical protein
VGQRGAQAVPEGLKYDLPPPQIVPVILLDVYQCHMMASVTDKIAILGIEIIHIPDGCTGLCQPLDVGIRSFKSRVRALWEEWMIDEIDHTGMVYAPTCEDISSWVAEVVWGMDGKNLMRNAWRKTGYDLFEGEEVEEEEGTADAVDSVGNDDDESNDIVNEDDDGGNFDEVDIADMLEDILGCGEDTDDESDDDEMLWGAA